MCLSIVLIVYKDLSCCLDIITFCSGLETISSVTLVSNFMSLAARKRKQDCYYLLSYDFSKYVYFETIQIFLSVQFSNFIYLMQVA